MYMQGKQEKLGLFYIYKRIYRLFCEPCDILYYLPYAYLPVLYINTLGTSTVTRVSRPPAFRSARYFIYKPHKLPRRYIQCIYMPYITLYYVCMYVCIP